MAANRKKSLVGYAVTKGGRVRTFGRIVDEPRPGVYLAQWLTDPDGCYRVFTAASLAETTYERNSTDQLYRVWPDTAAAEDWYDV